MTAIWARDRRPVCLTIAGLATLGMALLAGLVATSAQAAGFPAPPGCVRGLDALRAGHLEVAVSRFAFVRPQNAACARLGLTAATDFLLARSLVAVGLDSAADSDIERALAAEPAMPVPSDVVPGTLGRAGIVLAEALNRDGFHDQAVQVLLRVIRNDPGIQIPGPARSILGHPWYWHVWQFIWRNAPLLWAGLVLLSLVLYGAWRRRLHFQPFTGSDERTASESLAGVLRARIRAELHRLVQEMPSLPDGRRMRLDQAGPYEQVYDIGKVAESLPSVWKALAGATGQLAQQLGSRSKLVTGVLLPNTAVALGIETVNGRVEDMGVIEFAKLGFPDDRQGNLAQLALPSAAWILLARYPSLTLGGTTNWASWVAFAAGCEWQQRGDLQQAMTLYEQACRDPSNTAAAVNLAALEQLSEAANGYGDPASRPSHQRLRGLVKKVAPEDLQWYRSRYLFSMGVRDVLDSGSPPPNGHGSARPGPSVIVTEAKDLAAELAIRLDELRGALNLPWEFLEYGRAAALTLLARQVIPRTTQLPDVLSTQLDEVFGTDTAIPEFTDANIGAQLRRIASGSAKGDPERLVKYARTRLRLDDQARYNLLRYHRTRATICYVAYQRYRTALASALIAPENYRWRQRVSVWMRLLGQQYRAECVRAGGYGEQIRAAADPVLRGQLDILDPLPPQISDEEGGSDDSRGAGEEIPFPAEAPPERPPYTGSPDTFRGPRGNASQSPESPDRPPQPTPEPLPELESGATERPANGSDQDPATPAAAFTLAEPEVAPRRNRFIEALRRLFGLEP